MIRKVAAGLLLAFVPLCLFSRLHFQMSALCAVFFAAVLLILASKKPSKKCKTVVRILGVSVFVVLLAASGAVLHGGHDDACDNPPDFVVVLGAQTVNGQPGATLRERLDRAVFYAAENENAVFFCSGGKGEDEQRPEGDIMAEYFIANGVPADRVVSEPYAMNTRENLIFSAKLAGDMGLDNSRVVIITSAFHIARSKYIAKSLSMQPVGIGAKTENLFLLPHYVLREVFAFVKAFFVAYVL